MPPKAKKIPKKGGKKGEDKKSVPKAAKTDPKKTTQADPKKAVAKADPKKAAAKADTTKKAATEVDPKKASTAVQATSTRVDTNEGSHVITVVSAGGSEPGPVVVKADAPAVVEAKAVVNVAVPDPWADVQPEEQWKRLKEEDGTHIVGESGDDPQELVATSDTGNALWLKMEGADLESFAFSDAIRSRVTALDLSNNSLTSIGEELASGSTWIRTLLLAGNGFGACPNLRPYRCLVWLDLNFIEVEYASSDFAPLAVLRRLTMDNCGISSLLDADGAPLFGQLPSLEELSVQENELEDIDDNFKMGLAGLSGRMREFDLRENAAVDCMSNKRAYTDCIVELIPSLKVQLVTLCQPACMCLENRRIIQALSKSLSMRALNKSSFLCLFRYWTTNSSTPQARSEASAPSKGLQIQSPRKG
jgi:hypothetical protein